MFRFICRSSSSVNTKRPFLVVLQSTTITHHLQTPLGTRYFSWNPRKNYPTRQNPPDFKAVAKKSNLVVGVLKDYGLDDAQIAKVVAASKLPKNIRPKMEFLHEQVGMSATSLVKFVTWFPWTLCISLEDSMVHTLDFLRGVVQTKEGVSCVLQRCPELLRRNVCKVVAGNIELLKSQGSPEDVITSLMLVEPRIAALDYPMFSEVVDELKLYGFDPSTKMFVHALRVRATTTAERWNERVAVYKSFGWSDSEIFGGLKKWPFIFSLKPERIQKSLNFTMNKLKMSTALLLVHPSILTSSLEKRIIPRCCVLSILVSKGVIEREIRVRMQMLISDASFRIKYVSKYQGEYPEVLEAYEGKMDFVGLDHGNTGKEMIFEKVRSGKTGNGN